MVEPLQFTLIAMNTIGVGWLLKISRRPKNPNGSLVLDSCALIDGRIADIISGGFLQSDLVIPSFVLRELQILADGKDAHKRSRARYGLEVAEKLRKAYPFRVKVDESIKIADKTDELLLILCKKLSARLVTTDYNLGKIAEIEGVVVLNVNELSLALRTTVLPGDEKEIRIIQVGDSGNQGVGYLEDGTLVVVYGASKLVGTTHIVIIERSLQTVAGKMCFAHLKAADSSARRSRKK